MKATRYYGRGDIRIEEVASPSEPSSKQILVRPLYVGICGTDLHEYAHGPIVTPVHPHPFTGATLPQIIGHEFSAEVIAVGEEITHVHAGDRVSIQPLVMPLDDYYSRRGLHQGSPRMATIGLQSPWGGLAEFAMVNDYNAYKLPDSLDSQTGAVIEPAAVALSGVEGAGVRGGATVFIAGAGPIGALAALASAAVGANRIFVSEPNPVRRKQIEALGVASRVIDPLTEDPADLIRDETEEGIGVDSAVECSGTQAGLDACCRVLRHFGTVAQIGIHARNAEVNPTVWASKSLTIRGIWGFPITCWPRIMSMVERGQYPIRKIITRQIEMASIIDEGFKRLLDPAGSEMKIVVKVQ